MRPFYPIISEMFDFFNQDGITVEVVGEAFNDRQQPSDVLDGAENSGVYFNCNEKVQGRHVYKTESEPPKICFFIKMNINTFAHNV